ncbi:MAG: HlyD family efflux transporter periplasmic adaptor subunit [Clostridia bacterium]
MSELNERTFEKKAILPDSPENIKNKQDNFWKQHGKLKKRFIVLGILLIIGLIYGFLTVQKMLKPPTYNTAIVTRETMKNSISADGVINAKDIQTITLTPEVKILEVFYPEGSTVTAGTKLVKLDNFSLEYQLQKNEFALSSLENSRIAGARNAVSNAELNLAKVTADLREAETNKAQGITGSNATLIALDTLTRSLASAEKDLSDTEALFLEGFAAQAEVDAKDKIVLDLENQIKSTKLQGSTELETLRRQQKQAAITLSDARSSLQDLTGVQISSSKLDIAQLNTQVANSQVITNISGTIVQQDAKAGRKSAAGDKIIIQDLSEYQVKVYLNQYDAVNMLVGMPVNVTVKGMEDIFKGTISKIAATAELRASGSSQETTVEVTISLQTEDSRMRSGYEVSCEIITASVANTLLVPYDAVLTAKDGSSYVYLLKNKKVTKTPVSVGLQGDYNIEILTGLNEGDVLVLNYEEKVNVQGN